ncbi:MAG TPA: adenosylmethionine--8-amino-7-oxononanoate transaminase [Solirubrobacteraceae bacterium]|nr:adenosylmethionine--8-amino-7-oxononanoate transaminase [Solirubrobacteraceae bacterium]
MAQSAEGRRAGPLYFSDRTALSEELLPADPEWRRLLAQDREHVWHPYGGLPAASAALPVVSAEGVRLRLADGRALIDGMASWWCAVHGYRHPALDGAITDQLGKMAHVMFGGLTHEPAVRLAERLVQIAPPGLERVFFADSGSVAVEVAIKMCLQYQRAVGRPERSRLLTVRGGYHGDTFGAMGVCDPVGGMHSLFTGILPEHLFADRPPDDLTASLGGAGTSGGTASGDGSEFPQDERWERWAAQVRELAARHAHELAGAIVEPVAQGAGGMRFHSPACVRLLREVCDEHGMLLVADEVATGFGRTGALFACEHAGIGPDVMCVGKAITGGYMTLAATLCTADVAGAISAGECGGLMHGPTYMANPLACAVALASLDLLATDEWRAQVKRIEQGLRAGLEPARELPGVTDVRVLGAIGVVQLEREVDVAAATAASVERGVWLRPFRDLVYTMPPYVISDEDLSTVTKAVVDAARAGARDVAIRPRVG